MIERDVLMQTKYGTMPAFAVCPETGGPFPPVIFYMDAPGTREELRNMCRRIANRGYFCLLPDLYYRLGLLRFDIPRRNDAMSVVIRGAMNSLTNTFVAEDTGGMISFLDAQDKVKPGPIGCVGHCMSGSFVATVAARYASRIASAAALYGIGIVTDQPDSPHLLLDQVKGELYFAFAEVDPAVPAQKPSPTSRRRWSRRRYATRSRSSRTPITGFSSRRGRTMSRTRPRRPGTNCSPCGSARCAECAPGATAG